MALKQDGVHFVLNPVPRVLSYRSLRSEREGERERERERETERERESARGVGTFVT